MAFDVASSNVTSRSFFRNGNISAMTGDSFKEKSLSTSFLSQQTFRIGS